MRFQARGREQRRGAAIATSVVLCVALCAGLVGCSTTVGGKGVAALPGSGGSGFPAQTSSASASPLPSTRVAGPLSKAAFITTMDAICKSVDDQRNAVPTPSAGDFDGLAAYVQLLLTLFPQYLSRATQLAALTADNAELTQKWISIEAADFAVARPILERTLVDAQAHDAAKVNQDSQALQDAPDHSDQIAAFMTTYGLTDCAALETG